MTIKKAKIYIAIGTLLIAYNVFRIIRRMSKPLIDFTKEGLSYKLGYFIGSYLFFVLGIVIIVIGLISLNKNLSNKI